MHYIIWWYPLFSIIRIHLPVTVDSQPGIWLAIFESYV